MFLNRSWLAYQIRHCLPRTLRLMREQRLPVTVEGYTPGELEQRWCDTCGTPDGFRIAFFRKLANTDLDAPLAVAVIGCFACDERERRVDEHI
jgi:hypothetical protein